MFTGSFPTMASLPPPLNELIASLSKLPGIGPRSAERLALHLVQTEVDSVKRLAQALVQARERVQSCKVCGALTEEQPCNICADDRRDDSILCVVERAVDILPFEKSGVFKGKYHVLGGRISPLNGVGPEDLRIAELEERTGQGEIKEVILALGTDVEGDATGNYLSKRLAAKGMKVSRLAQGLPVGSGLEFADELTLSRAMEGRREV